MRPRPSRFSTGPALRALTQPDHHRLHVFRGSSLLHQEVDHALRFDHQVATEEKYTEHDGERQHAQHRDLHHTHDEEFALVLHQHQGPSAVAGHHVVGAIAGVCGKSPGEGLTPVKQRALGHVEEGHVHVSLRVTGEQTLGRHTVSAQNLGSKQQLASCDCSNKRKAEKQTKKNVSFYSLALGANIECVRNGQHPNQQTPAD